MKRILFAVPCMLALAPMFLARPAQAAPQTPECVAANPANGEGKFTGQISGGPNGSIFDVTSGAQSVTVLYNTSVLVCQGGQPTSANSLVLGANVVVYGPIRKKGKIYQMTATKILVAGPPVAGIRGAAQPINNYNPGLNPGGADLSNNAPNPAPPQNSSQDNWQAPAGNNIRTGGYTQGGAIQQGGGYPQGGGSGGGIDSWNQGDAKGRGGSQNTITCTTLEFSMKGGTDAATGRGIGRASASGITCKRPVDQLALQLFQDDVKGRRLGSVSLSWQNQLEVVLTNAEVSTIQFASDAGGQQVVEITFAYQKAELVHLPSNSHVMF